MRGDVVLVKSQGKLKGTANFSSSIKFVLCIFSFIMFFYVLNKTNYNFLLHSVLKFSLKAHFSELSSETDNSFSNGCQLYDNTHNVKDKHFLNGLLKLFLMFTIFNSRASVPIESLRKFDGVKFITYNIK